MLNQGMLDRIIRVIRLDQTVFAEIEKDENATVQAFIIVLVTSFLSALGSGFGAMNRFFLAFLGTFVMGIIGWVLWSFITLWIGTKLYDGKSDLTEMMRNIGYANAPRLLGLFAFIPCVGPLISLAGAILSLVAAFYGIRQALELDTTKTIATVVIGWVVVLVISLIVGALFAGTALTLGAIGSMLGGG